MEQNLISFLKLHFSIIREEINEAKEDLSQLIGMVFKSYHLGEIDLAEDCPELFDLLEKKAGS